MFDPRKYIQVARRLVKTQDLDREARTRSAINRAYYALFLSVWVALTRAQNRMGEPPPAHGRLKDALYAAKFNGLATALNSLYEERARADYRVDITSLPTHFSEKLSEPAHALTLTNWADSEIAKLSSVDFSAVVVRDSRIKTD